MKYITVEANGEYVFAEKVNHAIQMGWKPIGGVSVCEYHNTLRYVQAFIFEEDK